MLDSPEISQKTLNSPHIRRIGWEMAKGLSVQDSIRTVREKLKKKLKDPFYAELREKKIEAEKNALTDPLTGLHNRRVLEKELKQEFSEANRFNHDLTVVMIDLDRFKLINDTYGHSVGDEFLRIMAEAIKQTFRESDTTARYGGEEFCVILPETSTKITEQIIERLNKKYVDLQTKNSLIKGRGITELNTMSIGMVSLRESDQTRHEVVATAEELLTRADQALYAAKSRGRNQTVKYGSKEYWEYIEIEKQKLAEEKK